MEHQNTAAQSSDLFDQLLANARAGSESARNELFRQIQNYLGYVAGQHHNSTLAGKFGVSDVVQQTMLSATEDFHGFRGKTADEFRSWLRQILINKVRDNNRYFASKRRNAAQEITLNRSQSGNRAAIDIADSAVTPSVEMAFHEDSNQIRRILEKMPDDMRLVVQWRNWDGLQFNEIAERMGISLSKAAKLWYNALIELERLHAEMTDDRAGKD